MCVWNSARSCLLSVCDSLVNPLMALNSVYTASTYDYCIRRKKYTMKMVRFVNNCMVDAPHHCLCDDDAHYHYFYSSKNITTISLWNSFSLLIALFLSRCMFQCSLFLLLSFISRTLGSFLTFAQSSMNFSFSFISLKFIEKKQHNFFLHLNQKLFHIFFSFIFTQHLRQFALKIPFSIYMILLIWNFCCACICVSTIHGKTMAKKSYKEIFCSLLLCYFSMLVFL